VFDGVRAREAAPVTFDQEQLASIKAPVLLILGKSDNLAGDPEKVEEYTSVVPDIRYEVLEAGHAVWVEQHEKVNELIIDFLGKK